jgi:uncharacterized oxidoreductase
VESGLVSIHIVNVAGSVLVAPFGAVDRRFSTAPIAFGFPVEGEPPVVLDFATSAVAEGKVLVAANGGKPVPPGSLIGPDGQLSTDPATLYGPLEGGPDRDHRNGKGAIRAMGDHKGSGLALMCELLGGVLAGSGTSGPEKQRFANGMISIYLSPAAFGSAQDADPRHPARTCSFPATPRGVRARSDPRRGFRFLPEPGTAYGRRRSGSASPFEAEATPGRREFVNPAQAWRPRRIDSS